MTLNAYIAIIAVFIGFCGFLCLVPLFKFLYEFIIQAKEESGSFLLKELQECWSGLKNNFTLLLFLYIMSLFSFFYNEHVIAMNNAVNIIQSNIEEIYKNIDNGESGDIERKNIFSALERITRNPSEDLLAILMTIFSLAVLFVSFYYFRISKEIVKREIEAIASEEQRRLTNDEFLDSKITEKVITELENKGLAKFVDLEAGNGSR